MPLLPPSTFAGPSATIAFYQLHSFVWRWLPVLFGMSHFTSEVSGAASCLSEVQVIILNLDQMVEDSLSQGAAVGPSNSIR